MRLLPYFAYARKCFLNRSAYRFDLFMNILSTCLRIFIFWEIYKALYVGRNAVDGITMSMVTTNFILSIGLEAAFFTDDYFLPRHIWDGSISTELLRPISFRGRMLAENLGSVLFQLAFCFIPALLVSVAIMGMYPPVNVGTFCFFFLSALLGYGVLWAISFAVQMTAFWLVNIWSLNTIKTVLINVLSGSMIPLWFMPDWMQEVLRFTPFSSIYFTPVQIYLGQLPIGEILTRYLVQIFWIVLIFIIGSILWDKGQKKLVVQGG